MAEKSERAVGAGTVLIHAGDIFNRYATSNSGTPCWKSGASASGKWALYSCLSKNGYTKITIWAADEKSTEIETNGFIVKEIQEVKYGFRKYNEKYYPEISIRAVLEPHEIQMSEQYVDVGAVDEAELPFN